MALVGAVVVWGLAVAAAGLARDLWLVVLLLAVGGAADLVSAVYRQTILQTYAPDEMRGRMQGVFIVVVAGGPRLGDLRAGASAAAFGVTASWVGGGIACVVIVLALAAAVPALRNYRAGDGPAPRQRGGGRRRASLASPPCGWRRSWGGRASADETVAALRGWERPGDCGWQLHAGDIGWHLRNDDDEVEGTLLQLRDASGALAAVGLLDGPGLLRLALEPDHLHDPALAAAVADAAEDRLGRAGTAEAYVDGPAAARLARRARPPRLGPGPRPVGAPVAVARCGRRRAGRVPGGPGIRGGGRRRPGRRAAIGLRELHLHRGAVGPDEPSAAYDPRLDLLARDEDGTAVAALTAWSAGEGRCALVEPVATAAGHTRKGHGRRLLDGAAVALARVGASGVAVWTPASNEAALAAYRSAGFSAIGVASAMCSTAASTSSAQPQDRVTPAPPCP